MIHHCPITLEPVADGGRYSQAGLRALHPRLADLAPLPLSWEEQLREARLRADKMSIQGVQPKLSAVLKAKDGRFEIVDHGGRYILKPRCARNKSANTAPSIAKAPATSNKPWTKCTSQPAPTIGS